VNRIYLEPVPLACSSLDPRFVYLLDDNKHMYIWMGSKAKLMTRTKTRLFITMILLIAHCILLDVLLSLLENRITV